MASPKKSAPYEQAIRTPLVIAGPGVTTYESNHLVANNDLAVTIAQIAGVTPTRIVDGRSLVPLLTNPKAHWPRKQILIENYQERTGVVPLDVVPPYRALRQLHSKTNRLYVNYEIGAQYEFYDLAHDPAQLDNNIEALDSAQRNELDTQLKAFDQCVGSSCAHAEDH